MTQKIATPKELEGPREIDCAECGEIKAAFRFYHPASADPVCKDCTDWIKWTAAKNFLA